MEYGKGVICMRVAGIDAATVRTGMSLFADNKLDKYELIDLHRDKNADKRIPIMQNTIEDVLDDWEPDLVCIEDSWQGRNADTDKKIAYIIGAVMAYCNRNNIRFEKMYPSEWRRKVGIAQGKKKREELKQASIDYVKARFGVDVSDDVADAICVGYAGCLNDDELF